MSMLSENTQAILLLTAPLMMGRNPTSTDLLSAREYKSLARHLREIQRQPADLLLPNAQELIHECQHIVEVARLQRLLGRGFLLSQVVDRWQSRAIWIISRADANYPRCLKNRLREDAPPILYGCGDISLLETGGLAVVGSRAIDVAVFDYSVEIGRLAVGAGRTVISGGAKGVDQAAMLGAIQSGGLVCEVMAENLERAVLDAQRRPHLMSGRMVLVSAYDPSAGFNVGHAMQRNKLIYALADASLVVASDFNKGGTWAGATEQLDKLRFVPVYVRSTGDISKGLEALQKKGALPWPNPQNVQEFNAIFDAVIPSTPAYIEQSLFDVENVVEGVKQSDTFAEQSTLVKMEEIQKSVQRPQKPELSEAILTSTESYQEDSSSLNIEPQALFDPADILFATVRDILSKLLHAPMKDSDVGIALNVSTAQAKIWLQRLTDEGVLEKQKRPIMYVMKQLSLFK